MNMSSDAIGGLALIAALLGIAATIFWMFVGWRAMEAHERLAEAHERLTKATEEIARKMPIGKP